MSTLFLTPVEKNRWWVYTQKVRETLFSVFFFFMPFTQALTFNLGFPLKISEISLLALSAFYLFTGKKVAIPKAVIYTLGAFFFIVTVSMIFNFFWNYPYQLKEYPTRFGYVGDSIMRYIYFILAILSFFISVDIFLTNTEKYIRIWLYGAVLAALYAWYLVMFSFMKWPVFLLPGMENPPQQVNGIIRCGTFLEGNYMGLFLLISGGMSFYTGRYLIGLFLMLSIFTTFSTLSIISIPIFLIYFYRTYIFRKRYIPLFIVLVTAAVIAVPYVMRTAFYKNYIYEKLFSDIKKVNSNAAYSKADRIVTIKTALYITEDNFMLGVGLSNFGRHYESYYKGETLEPKLRAILLRKNTKVIPNNIYVEILTEAGIISLAVFLVFVIQLFSYSRPAQGKHALVPALLCMMLCFMAYPSFIMIYLWCFMALPVAHCIRYASAENPISLDYD